MSILFKEFENTFKDCISEVSYINLYYKDPLEKHLKEEDMKEFIKYIQPINEFLRKFISKYQKIIYEYEGWSDTDSDSDSDEIENILIK